MESFKTTAIYPNRLEDKERVESRFNLPEFPDTNIPLKLIHSNTEFAETYNRIVYGDHGPFIEFLPEQLSVSLFNSLVARNKHIVFEVYRSQGNKFVLFHSKERAKELVANNKYYMWLVSEANSKIKIYLQLRSVKHLPNPPKRRDGKPSRFNRKEGYADYKPGLIYIEPEFLERM